MATRPDLLMTVKELRELLDHYDERLIVVVPGTGKQDGGYVTLRTLMEGKLAEGNNGLEYIDSENSEGKLTVTVLKLMG